MTSLSLRCCLGQVFDTTKQHANDTSIPFSGTTRAACFRACNCGIRATRPRLDGEIDLNRRLYGFALTWQARRQTTIGIKLIFRLISLNYLVGYRRGEWSVLCLTAGRHYRELHRVCGHCLHNIDGPERIASTEVLLTMFEKQSFFCLLQCEW